MQEALLDITAHVRKLLTLLMLCFCSEETVARALAELQQHSSGMQPLSDEAHDQLQRMGRSLHRMRHPNATILLVMIVAASLKPGRRCAGVLQRAWNRLFKTLAHDVAAMSRMVAPMQEALTVLSCACFWVGLDTPERAGLWSRTFTGLQNLLSGMAFSRNVAFVDCANHGGVNAEIASPRVQEVRPEMVLEPENGALRVCLLSSVACLWMSD